MPQESAFRNSLFAGGAQQRPKAWGWGAKVKPTAEQGRMSTKWARGECRVPWGGLWREAVDGRAGVEARAQVPCVCSPHLVKPQGSLVAACAGCRLSSHSPFSSLVTGSALRSTPLLVKRLAFGSVSRPRSLLPAVQCEAEGSVHSPWYPGSRGSSLCSTFQLCKMEPLLTSGVSVLP